MARCEVCGNDYDKSFEVRLAGGGDAAHVFDSFGWCALRLQDHRTRRGSRRFDVLLRPLRKPGRR